MEQQRNEKGPFGTSCIFLGQITRFVGDPMSQRNPLFWSSDHHNQPPNLL